MIIEEEVRALFAEVDAPPSGVDLTDVVRTGARKVARRRVAEVAGGIVLVMVVGAAVAVPFAWSRHSAAHPAALSTPVPSAAPAPSTSPADTVVSCRPTVLPVPAGMTDVTAVVADPTGRYIGGNGDAGHQNSSAVLWTDGVPKKLTFSSSIEIDAIDSSGVAVGLASLNSREQYVFRYDHGKVTRMPTPAPGHWNLYAEPDINRRGDVVINGEPLNEAGGANSFTLVWRAGAKSSIKVPVPKGVEVFAITDDDRLIGEAYDTKGATGPWVWDMQGHGTRLPTPPGMLAAAYIASGDWVSGALWNEPSDTMASAVPLWNLATGELTVVSNSTDVNDTVAAGVNAQGWVIDGVGEVHTPTGEATAVLPAGYTKPELTNLGDNGLITGSANDSGGHGVPLIWHC